MKTMHNTFFLILAIFNTICYGDEQQAVAFNDYVSSTYLKSCFGEQENLKPVEQPAPVLSAYGRFKAELNKRIISSNPEAKLPTLYDVQKAGITLTKPATATDVIDSCVIEKLDILSSSEDSSFHLFGKLLDPYVHTSVGKAQALYTLCNPIIDVSVLKNRQQAVKLLQSNSRITQKFDSLFTTMKDNEQQSLSFWTAVPVISPSLSSNLYFNSSVLSKFNTSTTTLESYNRGWLFLESLYNAIAPVGLTFALHQQSAEMNLSYFATLKELIKSAYTLLMDPRVDVETKAFITIYPPLTAFGTASNFYNLIYTQKNHNEGICHLQDILMHTAQHMQSLQELSIFLRKDRTLLQLLPSLQPLADFTNPSKQSAQLKKLIGILNTNTFKGSPSFWSISGRVLATHKLVEQIKDEVAPVLVAAGELETYLAAAQLLNNANTQNNAQFCLADFVENSTTPVIDAHNFWNPFIELDKVVTNTITFDASCPNSILTGPNTGGKSTVIKALMLNCLLAQTFGIAAADKFALTPFAKLNCFMNISDDIATGASLFKSEVMRAKKLLDMVQNLKNDEFSFVIIDEVFTGTSPKEGESAACAFAKKLGSYTNNIAIIATHYPKMADLEQETNGMFYNHHIEVLQNEDGSLNRTFKLKNGPSFFNVAMNIIEEEGLFI